MSVILDALHKARGDKRGSKDEPQPNSVARVLEAGVAPGAAPVDFIGSGTSARRGRGWLTVLAVSFGLLCLLALIGGGFFLLYDQVRRLEEKSVLQAVAEPATVQPEAEALLNASPMDLPPPSALPAPLPVAELPVQPPVAAASVAMNSGDPAVGLPVSAPAATSHAPAVIGSSAPAVPAPPARPELKLGSIVCEAGVCVAGLNGRSVRVGDEIRGYTVTLITETAIELKSAGGNDIIRLSQFD